MKDILPAVSARPYTMEMPATLAITGKARYQTGVIKHQTGVIGKMTILSSAVLGEMTVRLWMIPGLSHGQRHHGPQGHLSAGTPQSLTPVLSTSHHHLSSIVITELIPQKV